ncbi:MAG: SLC13 family permease [Candidatus Nezhaarchaeota archaeon]|nr:SLC13 family permease [Candidatus Nezhaarchaeota archaeon]
MQLTALAIFLATIGFVIWGVVDRAVVAIIGTILMIALGVMSEVQAFHYVDWNVIAILLGIWIIANYFARTGVLEFLAVKAVKLSKGDLPLLVTLLGVLAGFVSMFVDNVVVILMFAPIVFYITDRLKLNPFPLIMFIGLCANTMGTALLLGDLPPQMLHAVSGIEFLEFVWIRGRPSSFIILTLTFLITTWLFYSTKFKRAFSQESLGVDIRARLKEMAELDESRCIKDRKLAAITVGAFIGTILAMSLRQLLGVKLGFIALTGALALVFTVETLRFKGKAERPGFEEVLSSLDWRAILFYIALFALVGGIEHVGLLDMLAEGIKPYLALPLVGLTILYWVTVPVVGIVEHDAYILTFLYVVKDLAGHGIDPWPLWWALLWSGTLGSNLTVAGAPALYVAINVCERNTGRKVSSRDFFSFSVPYVAVSTVVCYILAVLTWGL